MGNGVSGRKSYALTLGYFGRYAILEDSLIR